MCFSATASFVGAAAVGGVGAATLLHVRRPREVALAALPAGFALHQLTEGLVWLSLRGDLSRAVGDAAAYAYLFYAHGLLPVLAPVAVLLVERSRRRRRAMLVMAGLGVATGGYLYWADVANPLSYRVVDHSIAYDNTGSLLTLFAVLYVVATCGAALASSHRYLVLFGVANLVGLSVTFALLATHFTSVWCAYAALASTVILLQMRRWRQRTRSSPQQGVSAS